MCPLLLLLLLLILLEIGFRSHQQDFQCFPTHPLQGPVV